MATFPESAPVGPVVFYRTYSRRKEDNTRESWSEVSDRTVSAIGAIGDLTQHEMDLIKEVQDNLHGTVSGRFLWIGGTEWHKKPENYSGAFNCTSLMFDSLSVFGKTMDLTMMGCGVGIVLEPKYISKLPSVKNHINVEIKGNFGDVKSSRRTEATNYFLNSKENIYEIVVGDSRQGWAEAYQTFIDAAFAYPNYNKIVINISQIRPAYEKIKGFGGISEPTKFAQMFPKLAKILNGALGRQLTSVEICLLVDEAALVVVAGNVRRCLPEDALVFTDKGLIPIRDIQVGNLVETPIGLRPVTAKFNQGFQDVYALKVHSEMSLNGNYPRATLNHRIATRIDDSVKWVAISELAEGDKLVYLDTSSPKPYLPFNPIFAGLGDCKYMQTYDIEVEEAHCFYADGYLTHNSAGMRQFDKDDQLAAVAKENLWRQDEYGEWLIDLDRDALRMANHTRVYHQKPTLEECINAVRKQYYSGEGAIQWAGEAVARANADLIEGETEKHDFIKAYQVGLGREWMGLKAPKMKDDELDHRMKRYGLNPCLTGDTWVFTEYGARQIKDLIGLQHAVYVNGELFSTTREGFFSTGNQPVVKLQTKEGYSLRLTENHQLLKVTAQTQKKQYSEWSEVGNLKVGDRVLIHNHRNLQHWDGSGNFDQGWLLGNFLGDGCFSVNKENYVYQAKLRYWGNTQVEMKDYALALVNNLPKPSQYPHDLQGCYHAHNKYYEIGSASLAKLAQSFGMEHNAKVITPEIEQASYSFYCGFLRGLFDADGSVQGTQEKGVSVRLSQSNLPNLEAVQRMLLRLGIGSVIYQNRKPEGFKMLPNSKKVLAPYFCQAYHELVISNDNLYVFQQEIGFQEPEKSTLLEKLISGYKRNFNRERFAVQITEIIPDGVEEVYDCQVPDVNQFDANGFVSHNCGEIIGSDFHCNLAEVELNMIDPLDFDAQHKAFTAMSLSVAALLKQGFVDPLYQYSRTIDPIVGVSFTGLFDYFVNAFGIKWLEWWQAGRPKKWGEIVSDFNQFTDLIYPYDLDKLGLLSYEYLDCQHISWWFTQIETLTLRRWRVLCENVIKSYCQKHGIKTPNRCTTVQPAGCGSRELLRIFDQGLIYADEVMSDGQGEVEGINLSVRNGISASKGIANEPIHLLKITLNNKRLLRLTPNHRLSVEGNWVRADELIKGMKLDYQIGLYQSTNEAELIPVDLTAYRKYNHAIPVGIYQKGYLVNITIPEKMSASLGYFLGALFGNGCNEQKQGSSRIRFTHQNTEILNKISSISLKLFGISGCLTEDKRGDKHELSLSSNPLYDWFQINGMTKPVKSKDLDRIPQVLRCSSTESILGFFCGLIDTDGCVRESGSLSIESASEKFIRNLQQIGEAVGLCFSISHNNKGSNYQQEKSIWSLSLSRMLSDPLAVKFLNLNSFKCQSRPIPEPSREFKFNPYQIDKIEWELEPDYSFDFAVDGQDDDDSWYWQGAIKSHNSKSLLTNASPGWHPPKAAWVIRRVTVPKNDPVALACLDYGYNIIPSADDKDDEGNLLYDIFDSNCKSWLVEIPLQVSWGDLPGLEGIDINKFSALAQFDFYSIIQREWTGHNTSATIELRKDEIEELATAIYENIQNDEGYISAALLSRSDDLSVYPRLPFEPITKEKYDQLHNEVLLRRFPGKTFEELLAARDLQLGYTDNVQGPAGCDSDKCLLG